MFVLKISGIQNIIFLSLFKVINIFDDISFYTLGVALLILALMIERGSVKFSLSLYFKGQSKMLLIKDYYLFVLI